MAGGEHAVGHDYDHTGSTCAVGSALGDDLGPNQLETGVGERGAGHRPDLVDSGLEVLQVGIVLKPDVGEGAPNGVVRAKVGARERGHGNLGLPRSLKRAGRAGGGATNVLTANLELRRYVFDKVEHGEPGWCRRRAGE